MTAKLTRDEYREIVGLVFEYSEADREVATILATDRGNLWAAIEKRDSMSAALLRWLGDRTEAA